MAELTAQEVDARLRECARASREATASWREVDMSPEAVHARLRRVSQLRALCAYVGRMRPAAPGSGEAR